MTITTISESVMTLLDKMGAAKETLTTPFDIEDKFINDIVEDINMHHPGEMTNVEVYNRAMARAIFLERCIPDTVQAITDGIPPSSAGHIVKILDKVRDIEKKQIDFTPISSEINTLGEKIDEAIANADPCTELKQLEQSFTMWAKVFLDEYVSQAKRDFIFKVILAILLLLAIALPKLHAVEPPVLIKPVSSYNFYYAPPGFRAIAFTHSGGATPFYTNNNYVNFIEGTGITFVQVGSTITINSSGGGGGSGTVTNVLSGNLAGLFTVGIATSTTTPTFSFTSASFCAHCFWGNNTGAGAVPTAVQPAFTDVSGIVTNTQLPVVNEAHGGTNQSTYNKSDIIVATAANTLGAMAVGSDGARIIADSVSTNGVKYECAPQYVKTSTAVTSSSSTLDTSLIGGAITIPAGCLGKGRGIRVILRFKHTSGGAATSFKIKVNATTLGSISGTALVEGSLVAEFRNDPGVQNAQQGIHTYAQTGSSVGTFTANTTFAVNTAAASFTVDGAFSVANTTETCTLESFSIEFI